MKRVLIISPYFPPVNAADMQRVRMSLPYFRAFGWHAEVVMVDEQYSDIQHDQLLLQSIPDEIAIHKVKALSKRLTSKFGLGSIALRSLWFYKSTVNRLLQNKQFDLVYFSTTQFPVCILGSYWEKKFGVPYVIDMQDPWHSDYYRDKPRQQRPKKYWFSYRLNKYLEPIAMKAVSGLVAVAENYINDLKVRYLPIKDVPAAVIPFAAFDEDVRIAEANKHRFTSLLEPGDTNIVYVGRGGADMHKAILPLFKAVKEGLDTDPNLYGKLKLHFIGTSYAPAGQGVATILPLAKQLGVDAQTMEITDRISFYHTLQTLMEADGLFIPGSDDPKYTASKLYPYLSTKKPLLAIFNAQSPALNVLREYGVEYAFDYETVTTGQIKNYLKSVLSGTAANQDYDPEAIEKYSARQMTREQCRLFDQVMLTSKQCV